MHQKSLKPTLQNDCNGVSSTFTVHGVFWEALHCHRHPCPPSFCPPLSFSAYKDGTFCLKFHVHEDGWRQCDICEGDLHCGCIMSLCTYEMTDICGIICMKCVEKDKEKEKKRLLESNPDVASAIPKVANFSLVDNSNVSKSLSGRGILADPAALSPSNDDPKTLDSVVSLNISQVSTPGLVYLFEKKLTITDCNVKSGRFLVPRAYAEAFFPKVPRGRKTKPIIIKDTEGNSWNLTVGWWVYENSQKYIIGGIGGCLQKMKWEAGDIVKFYRHPDGQLVMELVKAGAGASSSGRENNPEMLKLSA